MLQGLLHDATCARQMLVAENSSIAARSQSRSQIASVVNKIQSPDNDVKTVFGDVGTDHKTLSCFTNFVASVDKATFSSETVHYVILRRTCPKYARPRGFYGSECFTA